MSQPAITVEGVTKVFKIPHERYSSLKQTAINAFAPKSYTTFLAVNDISLEIQTGEFFGIIGRNGCGKSTLLKMLAGIYTPTKGRIKIHGSLSPFIELGVGFNPELTARENVFLNGAILGLSRQQIEQKFDDIIGFGELEEFVDQKLKNFSSGMQVRLAFSIAIQAQADILLIDEVLAVGDSNFQAKCFEVFRNLKRQGKTVVFVSHDLANVERFCDRVMLVNQGKPVGVGPAKEMILTYQTLAARQAGEVDDRVQSTAGHQGTGQMEITKVEFLDTRGKPKSVFEAGEPFTVRTHFNASQKVERAVFGLAIFNRDNIELIGPNTSESNFDIERLSGSGHLDATFMANPLVPGEYSVTVGFFDRDLRFAYDYIEKGFNFRVVGKERHGNVYIEPRWSVTETA